MKKATVFILSALILSMLTIPVSASKKPITDLASLTEAINEASDGDTILVGDIDFTPTSGSVPYSTVCVKLDKSITLKSANKDGAVFKNGGIQLVGSKSAGEKITCVFENIVFDGGADQNLITAKDFEYPTDSLGETTFFAPMKAQQVLSFKGNVDASFEGCVFKNYFHEYGPIIDIRYGDYTNNPPLLDSFGDNSACKVGLSFDSCRIENNSSFYDGGAIYIEANNNVTLEAKDTEFLSNRSGNGAYRRGGGAIWAQGATLSFTHCAFKGNDGGYVYDGNPLPDKDQNQGGAIQLMGGNLEMTDCVISENSASVGGGLSLTNVKADFDGCFFTSNRAVYNAVNPYNSVGPWSNMGQGGAIYVEGSEGKNIYLINCTVADNYADMAYGSIYGYYNTLEDLSSPAYNLKVAFCDFRNNTVGRSYDYSADKVSIWFSHPGDHFENPRMSLFGCYIVDESFDSVFPRDEKPSEENGYNYFSKSESDPKEYSVPDTASSEYIEARYGGKLKGVHIGSNYDISLYRTEEKEEKAERDGDAWKWLIVGASAVLAATVAAIILTKNKPAEAKSEKAEDKPQIIMLRYDDGDIDRFMSLAPETSLLTQRESQVLRELLHGKKQSEVAYYLGIEVSTVKDFYKKIYAKLDVPNKDGLFKKVSEVLNK